MLQIYTVSFFGHREIDRFSEVETKVSSLVRSLIQEKPYVDFLVGRNGEFDQLVTSEIRRAKQDLHFGNSSLIWVMPYNMAEYRENRESFDQYYDSVEICPESCDTHPKTAYQIRNRSMVERSDLVVFFVTHESGGAYQTMQYAKRIGKDIINITDSQ